MNNQVSAEIWAHRGASAYRAENSMEAFELAIAQHADGIELDVHLSADDHLIVTHDENLRRLTGLDRMIAEMSYAEISRLNFGESLGTAEKVRAPLLEDVLDLIRNRNLKLNIELKNDLVAYDQLEEKALAAVRRFNLESRVIFSSFNHESMKKMRSFGTESLTGLLFLRPFWRPWQKAVRFGAQAIHPFYKNLYIPGYVRKAADCGIQVNAWTLNTAESIRFALRKGCHAIITNYPDVAIRERETCLKHQPERK